jgi:predicted Zn-dependent protease
MIRKLAITAAAAVTALVTTSCAMNPATGRPNVVLTSTQGEREQSRRYYEQIIRAYGLYEDQAVQDYVQQVGDRVAKQSHLGDRQFKFVVLDDESINAFTTGGDYVYVHRGLLTYLNSEAELAAVLGHEVGHVTARHPARAQTRGLMTSILATGAVIATGSSAVAQLANIGGTAFIQGYGRAAEMEADRFGLEYSTKAGYRPEAMGEVFKVFKAQESFEVNRAREEGREPQLYHGIFSSHPSPDQREIQAAKKSANITDQPEGGWVDNREEYMKAIDGLPYGSSRAQGIVRENRFYHADMGITLAFPRGYTIENQRDRLLAFTKSKDAIMQLTADARPEKESPREFLLKKLRGASVARGESVNVNGMEGYALVTRNGSPLDGGQGPVRWAVLYRDKSAFVFGAASRASSMGTPADDGIFMSTIQTVRNLKPSEYPLAQPYRLKVVTATEKTKLEDYAKDVPVEKYKKEELQLLNGVYPNGKLTPGQQIKVVE